MNERTQFGRIKPWEGYKFQTNDNLGLLSILNQQEIDSVQVVYFTQEEYKEENKSEITGVQSTERDQNSYLNLMNNDKVSQGTSQREQKFLSAIKRSTANMQAVD